MLGIQEIRWVTRPAADPARVELLARSLGLRPLVVQLLLLRGFEEEADMKRFLHPRLQDLADPFLLPDMERAVTRILEAIDARQSVVLYGDYDVDGVTSLTLLQAILAAYGLEAHTFLPHRTDEGYGLNEQGLERCLTEFQPALLIAVDCGTSSIEPVRGLRDQGIDVLIFDHHESNSGEAPPANAVVNPKLGDDFHYLCSAGVVFKLGHALLKTRKVPGLDLRHWLDIVALGTVADLVPLVGENRILVRKGLQQLEHSLHPGIQALKEVAGVLGAPTAYDIGFKLGPRLNAAGRLDTAQTSLDLLTCTDPSRARDLAASLNRQNQERQDLEGRIKTEALALLDDFAPERDHAIVLGSADWHPGVVGIVASRITKQFHRPTFVIAFDQDGFGKGSGRSIEGVSLVDALNACRSLLEAGGGHDMAAGLSLRIENLDAFRAAVSAYIQQVTPPGVFTPRLDIDLEARLSEIDLDLLDSYELVHPMGMGNPAPLFMSRGVHLAAEPRVLKEKHLKLPLAQNGATLEAMFFNTELDSLPPEPWDIAYRISRNVWRGRVSVSTVIEAIRPAA